MAPERVAVVTGGAGAIGSAICDLLKSDGFRVVILDRIGDITADLSSESSARAAGAAVLERYGHCDVFVHCAGAFNQSDLQHLDSTTWRHVQAVNVESPCGWLSHSCRGWPSAGSEGSSS